jgi:hypothetical protein
MIDMGHDLNALRAAYLEADYPPTRGRHSLSKYSSTTEWPDDQKVPFSRTVWQQSGELERPLFDADELLQQTP